MPPKKTPQRRSRKETLEEDLTKLINEWNTNDEEVFLFLKEALSEGVDVDLVVGNQTLICYFAFFGMLKCFEECFLLGADPTILTPKHSMNALVGAIRGFGSPPIVSRIVMFLLNHAKVTDSHQEEALTWACDFGRFEIVRLFLRRNKVLAHKVMSWGLILGSTKLVEIALEFSADVNQRRVDGQYLVHRAAELEDSSILQKLLDAGADTEAKHKSTNETPFEVAVRCNNVNCVKFLIDRKCEFSSKDALLLAIYSRSHDVLSELLRNEASSKVVNEEALTLLNLAVAQGDLTAFKIVYPFVRFHASIIYRLVRFQKYDMLSAALFEFEHPGLSIRHLTPLIAQAPDDDIKSLLQKKIDAMYGVDLVVKVKKEAEEEEEKLRSASTTKKKTTKTTTNSKKK